ncbi:carotenoid oxygenase family protein [Myxococcaceae bacterium JPH2]|nr:carotenoid oxygenase family protein [Myxococcaceae bacterium JPH2]
MARLWRWTFDLDGPSDIIQEVRVDHLDGEFPRINERCTGPPHRHGWYDADTAEAVGEPLRLNAIVHRDGRTGHRSLFELPRGDLTFEPVFLPRSPTAPEGDGWLTAVVWRASENHSDLLVFDAQDVAQGLIAAAAVPRRVPASIEAGFLTDAHLTVIRVGLERGRRPPGPA